MEGEEYGECGRTGWGIWKERIGNMEGEDGEYEERMGNIKEGDREYGRRGWGIRKERMGNMDGEDGE